MIKSRLGVILHVSIRDELHFSPKVSIFLNLFFYWRIIALQNFVVFCQTPRELYFLFISCFSAAIVLKLPQKFKKRWKLQEYITYQIFKNELIVYRTSKYVFLHWFWSMTMLNQCILVWSLNMWFWLPHNSLDIPICDHLSNHLREGN